MNRHIIVEDSYEQASRAVQFSKTMLKNAQIKKLPSITYWSSRLENARKRLQLMRGSKNKVTQVNEPTHATQKNSHWKNFKKELSLHTTAKAVIVHGKHTIHDLGKAFKLIKGSSARKTKLFQHLKSTIKSLGKIAKNINTLVVDAGQRLRTNFTPDELRDMQNDPDTLKDKLAARITPKELAHFKTAGKVAYATLGAYLLYSYGAYLGGSAKNLANVLDTNSLSTIMDLTARHLPEAIAEHVQHATGEAAVMTVMHAVNKLAKFENIENNVDGTLLMQLMEVYTPIVATPAWQNAFLKGIQDFNK